MIVTPQDLPDELLEDFNACAADPDLAVQAFFRIRNRQGILVQFLYNLAQQLIVQRGKGFPFITVLKDRKRGISSQRFGTDLWKCATLKNQHRILLTHTDEAAEKLLEEKIIPLHDNCLIPLGGRWRKSDSMLYFPATNSRYYVGTAGNRTFGRGDDINGRHFSEKAHWKSPDVQTGVDEAMMDGGDGLTETTANGYNFFKKEWEAAKRGQNGEKAIFLPWMVGEENVRDSTGLVIGGEEAERAKALGLTPEQIAWRRWKISTMKQPELFPQEHPEIDSEAFLSPGRPVFDSLGLIRAKAHCEPPKFVGYLRRVGNRVELVEDKNGPLKVWKIPQIRHVYGIGADVAEGIEGGAYSAAPIFDIGDGSQVAEWHGHTAPDLFGEELALLSAWYNQAVLVPEAWPGPGGTTYSKLVDLECNLWADPDHDQKNGGNPGWETTRRTKPLIINLFNAAIRDREVIIKSQDLIDECHAYHYLPNGEMAPSTGQFSDRLMGAAIVWYVTRDMAAKISYDAAPKVSALGKPRLMGTSVPKFQGPRLGVRNSD